MKCVFQEGIGWYGSVAEHLPTRKGPVFDTLDRGSRELKTCYVKAVVVLVVFSRKQPCLSTWKMYKKKAAQEERETKNEEPPRERK